MRELVVISGKGGTGKTSIVGSFAALARRVVLADCDVDAADLHLLLDPQTVSRQKFSGGKRARIKSGHCTACGKCEELCRFDAICFDGPGNGRAERTFRVDPIACEGCGVCAWFCAEGAIEFAPADNGEWFVSETRCGPMVHARLGAGEENSGKLVNIVRTEARRIARQRGLETVLVDGSPGIGCPVIASITGANLVLVVTEPTLSGQHDLERVTQLTRHFGIRTLVCINKWDLNPQIADGIESRAREAGAEPAGRVRYDRTVTAAQIRGLSVVECQQDGCSADVRELWTRVRRTLEVGGGV
ncbi:MAG: Electron transport complex subunit RsxB [Planctomycetes bacterium ADurb.Bin126]|nr:MAG: Electron transport complex subunit RsxB [Planctomycetes bacterium ADurb.Bin126]HOD84070.1 ATP-binding protein [Phycisphaerae bacterium]HQL76084.1 ATP-binding protein [Phycisphaerae bacterium]